MTSIFDILDEPPGLKKKFAEKKETKKNPFLSLLLLLSRLFLSFYFLLKLEIKPRTLSTLWKLSTPSYDLEPKCVFLRLSHLMLQTGLQVHHRLEGCLFSSWVLYFGSLFMFGIELPGFQQTFC